MGTNTSSMTKNSPLPTHSQYSNWLYVVVASVVVVVSFIGAYWETFLALTNWWRTTSKYAHSFIIFPAIAYLIYEQRHQLKQLSPKLTPIMLTVLLPASLLLPVFIYIDVQILSETLLVLVIPLIFWVMVGHRVMKVVAIPMLLLITVAPIWELFAPILTQVTADVAQKSLNLLGVPVFRDEMYLTIPEGVFEIAEGCGGFRYFIAGLSLGLIFAYLNFDTFKKQLFVVIFAVFLSVVTNWIRVMIVIWAGHVTDMQHPYVQEHVNLGWYVFSAAFFLFFFLFGKYFSSKSRVKIQVEQASSNMNPGLLSFVSIGLVVVLIAPSYVFSRSQGNEAVPQTLQGFSEVSGWDGPLSNASKWNPNFQGATHNNRVTFSRRGLEIDFYYALYRSQEQGKELVNVTNKIGNEDWQVFTPKLVDFEVANGHQYEVTSIRVDAEGETKTIWLWYRVAGIETRDRRLAKLLELMQVFSDKKESLVFAVLMKGDSSELGQTEIKELIDVVYRNLLAEVTGNS